MNLSLNTHDLFDLLVMYQGSIGTRVFSAGNQDYLEVMIRVSKQLGKALAEAPISSLLPRAKVVAVVERIEAQEPPTSQQSAREVLGLLHELLSVLNTARRVPDLHVRGALPPLPEGIDRIVVHFGAAMGLGDQITFFQLLRHIVAHAGRPQVTIYTLYPGIWPVLLPGAEEVSYRDDPLRPFLDMNASTMKSGGRELVVSADFEVFDLHRNIIAHRPWRDILEVSLGRASAWLSSGRSAWIHVEELRTPNDGNYDFMHELARRLIPRLSGWAAWEPLDGDVAASERGSSIRALAARLRPRRPPPPAARRGHDAASRRGRRQVLFLNPFTSKDLPFKAEGWAWGIEQFRSRVRGRVDFEVVVFPGIEPSSRAFTRELCERLEKDDAIPTRPLDDDGRPLTPLTALPALVRAVSGFDLCVTVDTFTAHLIPLFRIPTVVMAYERFRRFWVPSRHVYNCLIEDMEARGIDLVSRILLLLAGSGPETAALTAAADRLRRATRAAHLGGVTAASAAEIEAALGRAFQLIGRDFPSYADAQHWLMLWSRLSWTLSRQAVPAHGVRSYLELWEQSEIFKLLTLAAP